MSNIITRPDWHLPEQLATAEADHQNRRRFLKQGGLTAAALALGTACRTAQSKLKPGARNPLFNPEPKEGWRVSDEKWATSYNVFFEFTPNKNTVSHPLYMDPFVTDPWPVTIGGLVRKPWAGDAQELIERMKKMGALEERVYRFRCVEAWGMVLPWTGFKLRKIIELVQPKAQAKFVKFTSFNNPKIMGPWLERGGNGTEFPYTEGLRLDEAKNPLPMLATGMYGKPLPKQNGAPLRLVVPWKYGYKDIKSIVRIDFTDKQPETFWGQMLPNENPFESNVDPDVPHPRWSQKFERRIGPKGRVPTLKYNGYGKQVAALYQ